MPSVREAEYFITKDHKELGEYFDNAAIDIGSHIKPVTKPKINIPAFLQKELKKTSIPFEFKNNNLNNLSFFPPFKKPAAKAAYKPANFIDENSKNFFKLPLDFKSDASAKL